MKKQFSIPVKSRDEIIDTALQREKEWRVLKMLGLLLILALAYEFGGDLIHRFAQEDIPIAELGKIRRKRKIPPKAVTGLMNHLSDLQERVPLTRPLVRRANERLAVVYALLDSDPTDTEAALKLKGECISLWKAIHLPLWEDSKPFAQVKGDLENMFKRLETAPPPTKGLPETAFGPRKLTRVREPRRDLFQFATAWIPGGPREER